MDGIVTVADFEHLIWIVAGYGDEIYEQNKHSKQAIRQIVRDVLGAIHDLNNTKGGIEWRSREGVLKMYTEFLKKYNNKELWRETETDTL